MAFLTRLALTIGTAVLVGGCSLSQLPAGAHVPQRSSFGSARSTMHGTGGPGYRVLYGFKNHSDGNHPIAGLAEVNGTLYGTTLGGGSAQKGTVYRITTDGDEIVLHSFGRGSDGAAPQAKLIDVRGTLYGTTASGGEFKEGTVYSVTTTGTEKVLYSFRGGSDGARPEAALINVNGVLYGTTIAGGSRSGCGDVGCGTVYRITTTGSESVLYRFKGGAEGADLPQSRLRNFGGTLYGTTYLGGSSGCAYHAGCGVVFSLTTGGTEKLLYHFKGGADGENPIAGLIEVNGLLYGTTTCGGGKHDCGTAYTITKDGTENVLHRFQPRHGYSPETELIYSKGTFYGTTTGGGSHGDYGTIYRLSSTGAFDVLHNFAGGSDGQYPQGTLVEVNGTLYGTTYYGGGGGAGTCCGTVFALVP